MRLIAILSVITMCFAWLATATSPTAYASCNPGRSPQSNVSLYDGWLNHPGVAVVRTWADIKEYNPYVYNGIYDPTSQWVMLVTSYGDYAQVGWIKGLSTQWFVEANQYGFFTQTFYTDTASYGDSTTFDVQYVPALHVLYFYIQSQHRLTIIGYGGTPNEAQQFAEIHNRASQFPGGTVSHSAFYSSGFARSNGTTWLFNDPQYPAIIPANEPAYAGHSNPPSWNYIYIWDTACQT